MPFNIFNGTTPSLTSLELKGWHIFWESPLLKGLRILKIELEGSHSRPMLEDWLNALDQMPQLETLVLQNASPYAPLTPEPSRTITLPSLTKFRIDASAKDCVVALAHLVLPALTWLHVDAKSEELEHEDVRLLIPHVLRNVYVLQGTEQLRNILIGDRKCAEVRAWTMFHDGKSCGTSVPENLIFIVRSCHWQHGVDTAILEALLTQLPLNSVSALNARNIKGLSKEFWLSQAPRWPMLEWASLDLKNIKPFSDMLAEDAPPDGPRLPSLTKLILEDAELTVPMAYDLRDMLIERVEQGAPLEILDLGWGVRDDRAVRLLAEIVVGVDVQC